MVLCVVLEVMVLGVKRSDEAKATIRARTISAIGVQLSRYLTNQELRHPDMVTGDVNEVKNFNSLRARRYWCRQSRRAKTITDRLNRPNRRPNNKLNGYTYLIKVLTPEEKNALKMELNPLLITYKSYTPAVAAATVVAYSLSLMQLSGRARD